MKTYTLTEAQQLVKDDLAFIEFDVENAKLLSQVCDRHWNGKCKYYNKFKATNYLWTFDDDLIKIKLSQIIIQPDPIPNDVLKIVEKYGLNQVITFVELIKK